MFHMTEEQKMLMFQNKCDFVEDMGFTLKAYPEFGLKSIEYKKDEFDEYLRIAYRDGHVSWICVTGNSISAILKCITDDLRGYEPPGLILRSGYKAMLEKKTDWEEIK